MKLVPALASLALVVMSTSAPAKDGPPPPPSSASTPASKMVSSVQVRVLRPDASPVEGVPVVLADRTSRLVCGVTDSEGVAILQAPVGFELRDGAVAFGFAEGPSMPSDREYARLLPIIERLHNEFAVERWTPLSAAPPNIAATADATAVIQLKPSVAVKAKIVREPDREWQAHVFGEGRASGEQDKKARTVTLRGVARGEPTTIFVGIGSQITPVDLTAEQTQQELVDLGEFRETGSPAKASLRIELRSSTQPLSRNARRSYVQGVTLVARDGKTLYTYYGRVDPLTKVLSAEAMAGDARPTASRLPTPGDYYVAPGWFVGPSEDQLELLKLVRSGRAAEFSDIPVITVSDDVPSTWTIDLLAAREAIMAASARVAETQQQTPPEKRGGP